jgi:mannose-6-phosphate isomerase-like protein (cupin superfamily)
MSENWHFGLEETLATLPDIVGRRVAEPLARGSMIVKLYSPREHDPQVPHEQDEIYVVMRGSGVFSRGEERCRFRSGDVLFVPAGMTHRFEEFEPGFAAWVVFWGPKGGELPASSR